MAKISFSEVNKAIGKAMSTPKLIYKSIVDHAGSYQVFYSRKEYVDYMESFERVRS